MPQHHMPLYPNILDTSAANTTLAPHHETQIPHQPPFPNQPSHPQHHHHHHHHQTTPTNVSGAVATFFSHMFAPTSHLAYTCSTPRSDPTPPCPDAYTAHDKKPKLVVDDDIVVMVEDEAEEEDGGPLCREATIASWKAGGKKESSKRRRGRSLQWLADVIRR